MTLSNNLEKLMQIHGNISVSELARSTQLPQPTLHHILSGDTKNPRKKALETLAKFFSVSTEQLLGKEPLPHIIPEIMKESLRLRTIPIIQWDMLKKWPKTAAKNLKEVLLDKEIGTNSFALVIEDSSMEPMFPQDALLIFDAGKPSSDRDFIIAHVARDDKIFFNRLFVDKSEDFIKQELENGDVSLIKLDKKTDRIIGTLIEVRIQY